MPRSYINEFPDQPSSVPIDPTKLHLCRARGSDGPFAPFNCNPAVNAGNVGGVCATQLGQLPIAGTYEGASFRLYSFLGGGASVNNYGDNSGAAGASLVVGNREITLGSTKRSFFRCAITDGLWTGRATDEAHATQRITPGWILKDSNGNYQAAVGAGFTGAVMPVWNVVVGGNTVDGTVTWKNIGPWAFPQRHWIGAFSNRAAPFVGIGTDTPWNVVGNSCQFAAFRYSTNAPDLNWKAVCGNTDLGNGVIVDTKIPIDNSGASHEFQLLYTPTSVKFLYDDALVATITTFLPFPDRRLENIVNTDNVGTAPPLGCEAINIFYTGWEDNH